MIVFVKFREEMNVLFSFNLSEYKHKFPTKLWLTNPFTGKPTNVYFKSLTKNQTTALFIEGNKEGEIKGG